MADNGQYFQLPSIGRLQIKCSFTFRFALWRHRWVPEAATPLKQGLPSSSAMLPCAMLRCLQALKHCDLSRTCDPVWHCVAPFFSSP